MSRVTSKLQVTIPKALASRYGIRPGDDIRFEASEEIIRVIPSKTDTPAEGLDTKTRLRFFDAATDRQQKRDPGKQPRRTNKRGWTREELYERGRSDLD